MIISTELYGEHKDHYSIYEIESYIASAWLDSDTGDIMEAINGAIQDNRGYIVLPVSNDSDITINFTYEA